MFSSTATFSRNLETATSQPPHEVDWDAVLRVCNAVREQSVTPRYALGSLKKKIQNENPRVGLTALQVLESCVKNCGIEFHKEVATEAFMNVMKDLLNSPDEALKNKAKELLQVWAHAFRDSEELKAVGDTLNELKNEGHSFPDLEESDAMFTIERAPKWAYGDRCFNCQAVFGVILQRRHHCRHCGQTFCWKCSSKEKAIPNFGIERPVRVCDSCHRILSGNSRSDAGNELSSEPLPANEQEANDLQLALAFALDENENQHRIEPVMSEQEGQEEEDRLLALAMVLNENENKNISEEENKEEGEEVGEEEDTRQNASPIEKKRVLPGGAIVVGAVVLLLAVIMTYSSRHDYLDFVKADNSICNPYKSPDCDEFLFQQFKKLKQKYYNQSSNTWVTLYAAALGHVSYQPYPQRPIVIMVYKPQKSPRVNEILEDIAGVYNSVLLSDRKYGNISIQGESFTNSDPEEAKKQIQKVLKNGFETEAQKVAIVHDFDKLPSSSVLTFHGYCNNDNAPHKDVAIILTVTGTDTTFSSDPNSPELEKAVSILLHEKWKDYSVDLPPRTIDEMLSTVANNVILLR